MDDVQSGKTEGRRGHFVGSHVRVARCTGGIRASVGRSQATRDVATTKHGQSCSICRSDLQVHLSAEREGCVLRAKLKGSWGAGEDSGAEGKTKMVGVYPKCQCVTLQFNALKSTYDDHVRPVCQQQAGRIHAARVQTADAT
jgi:hypothetical protein